MRRKSDPNQLSFEDVHLPFGRKLRRDNRGVILSKQIPRKKTKAIIDQMHSLRTKSTKKTRTRKAELLVSKAR